MMTTSAPPAPGHSTPGERAADAVGSAANSRLAALLRGEPALCRRGIVDDLSHAEWLRASGVHISAWPLFVGRHIVEQEFHALTAELPPALYRALRARFGSDSDAFARYFGWPRLVYDLLLRAPVDPAELVCRYDVALHRGHAQVLELNCSSAAGGWQTDWAAQAVARSLRLCAGGERWPVVHRRVFDQLLKHVFSKLEALPKRATGSIALYTFVGAAQSESFRACLQARYDALRPASIPAGRIALIDTMTQLTFSAHHDVYANGEPVDAVLLTFPDAVDIPQAVLDGLVHAYLHKRIVFPDSPMHAVLDSKLMLAVAHEAIERGLVNGADARVIRRFLPWSMLVRDESSPHEGGMPLQELVDRRETLVLKKADSFGGRHVVVGRFTDPDTWRGAIERCCGEQGWIAQSYCDADPLDLPRTDVGVMPHDVVWGVFGFGGKYGGAFARGTPRASSRGVVNAAGGAHEFLVFEDLG